jgi:DNA repair protein RecO (recombination protein O)
MGFTRTEAIVLKTKNLREADKLITLYTRDRGKMQAVAKGLRKVKAKYGASLEMFTHNQVMLFAKTERDIAKITGCKVLHPFYGLRESFFKYSMASYLLELVDRFSQQNQANDEIFNLLGKSLSLMETGALKTRENYLLLWDWFALRVLEYSGYRLALDRCMLCQDRAPEYESRAYVSLAQGGLVCPECLGKAGVVEEMHWEDLQSLRRLQVSDMSHLAGLDIKPDSRLAVKNILEAYFTYLLGYSLNCSEFFLNQPAAKAA